MSDLEQSIQMISVDNHRRYDSLVLKLSLLAAISLIILLSGFFYAYKVGWFDRWLSTYITTSLNSAFAHHYRVKMSTGLIDFDARGQLVLEARDLKLIPIANELPCNIKRVRLSFNPWSLLFGSIAMTRMDIEHVEFDQKILDQEQFLDFRHWRVDALPDSMEGIFSLLERLSFLVDKDWLAHLNGLSFSLGGHHSFPPFVLTIENLLLSQKNAASLSVESNITLNGKKARFMLTADKVAGRITSLKGKFVHLPLDLLTLSYNDDKRPNHGLDAEATVTISAKRRDNKQQPFLSGRVEVNEGTVYYYGIAAKLRSARLDFEYDNHRHALNMMPSVILLSEITLPFSGILIDLDHLDHGIKHEFSKGIGIDILVKDGQFKAKGSNQEPLIFDAKASGEYAADEDVLYMNNLDLSSSLKLRFDKRTSPEISFGGRADSIKTAAIKQFWPFLVAPDVRSWVVQNLDGRSISNASISVFIPHNRLDKASLSELHFTPQELKIDFDIKDTRLSIVDHVPPLRDTFAHLGLSGSVLRIDFKNGKSYFPSGRSVTLSGGYFTLPSIYEKPLMANTRFSLSGTADAIAELVSCKPFQMLDPIGYHPEDIVGHIDADIDAQFPLSDQPVAQSSAWKIAMRLHNIRLPHIANKLWVTNLNGSLATDLRVAHLNVTAKINGMDAEIALTEPLTADSEDKREYLVTFRTGEGKKRILSGGLGNYIAGSIKIDIQKQDENRQKVHVDLGRANVFLPWFGWNKVAGQSAHLRFEFTNDLTKRLTNIRFGSGDALAIGEATFDGQGIAAIKFSRLQVSPFDNFSLDMTRIKEGWDIVLDGKALDLRLLIDQLRYGRENGFQDYGTIVLHFNIDKTIGFNNEIIQNLKGLLIMNSGGFFKSRFTAAINNGSTVMSHMADDRTVVINSDDAGALARFLDCYQRMKGGILNLKINGERRERFNGFMEVSNFSLINERNLQSLVSMPIGKSGRSLNTIVKRDIVISSGEFQKISADFLVDHENISIKNGILRGSLVGASFQGTLRNAVHAMDMTGTFMPAYGLNRLFSELPLVGNILGNGRDRGLIGIVFKIAGNTDAPRLTINPLSLITPGIFRKIFSLP